MSNQTGTMSEPTGGEPLGLEEVIKRIEGLDAPMVHRVGIGTEPMLSRFVVLALLARLSASAATCPHVRTSTSRDTLREGRAMPEPGRLARAASKASRAYYDARYVFVRNASNAEGEVTTIADPWRAAVLAAAAVLLEPWGETEFTSRSRGHSNAALRERLAELQCEAEGGQE